jgi:1-acyl-sn-glycerol-3-phosphate acyltransferase
MWHFLISLLTSFIIWTFFFLTLIPLFLVYFLIWLITWSFDHQKRIPQAFLKLWTRVYLRVNPAWAFTIENIEGLPSCGPCIYIANHQSILDIALLMQLPVIFRWVSKIELSRVPFIGWVIWMNNHIMVRRGDKKSALKMAEACKDSLSQGISVFFFPEGTRSTQGKLMPFKEGAFILAKDTETPLVPLAIEGTGNALPRKSFRFQPRQVFTIRVLRIIDRQVIQANDPAQLAQLARDLISGALAHHPQAH